MAVQQVLPEQLKDWLADRSRTPPLLLDVREPWEVSLCQLPGSVHMPMGSVASRAGELDPETDIVVVCHHGARSMQAALWLERNGFGRMHNLSGGIDAWARQVDSSMATY